MLSADDELFADLTAPSYVLERGLYKAEAKDKVCARLGRSTNKGDAVTGAWTAGPIASTDGAIWDQMRKEMGHGNRMGGRRPTVIMGRHNAKR